MKAINYLKQIKHMSAKIDRDIEELVTLEALATKTTAALGDERVQSSGSQQKMADAVAKIVDAKEKINYEIDSLINYKEAAKRLLDECDADCMMLLYKRYFMDKTWEEIAVEMEFTYRWVSGGLHQKALAQFQKALDKERI